MGFFIFIVLIIFNCCSAYHGFNWDQTDHFNRDFNSFNPDRIYFQDNEDYPTSWNNPERNWNNPQRNWNNPQGNWNNPQRNWNNPQRNWNNPQNNWNNNNNQDFPNNPTESSLTTSTVAVPGMATTRSPCENACKITQEYNPVCGTNGVTYANERWLKCAQNCGRRVDVSFYGSCPRVG